MGLFKFLYVVYYHFFLGLLLFKIIKGLKKKKKLGQDLERSHTLHMLRVTHMYSLDKMHQLGYVLMGTISLVTRKFL